MPSILLAAPLLTRSASILYLIYGTARCRSRLERHTHTHTEHRHQRLCPSEPPAVCAAASSESVYRAVQLISTKRQSAITPARRASATATDACSASTTNRPVQLLPRTPLKSTSNQQCTRSESASYDRARIAILLLRLGLGRLVQHSTQRTTCSPTCDSTGGGPQTRPRRLRINLRLRLSTAISSRP